MNNQQFAPLILVVDDNETKRYTVVRTLAGGGYRIIEAESGREALEKAAANLPDLMVVDIKMPDMDGFEVCRQIKSTAGTSYIPVLYFSAAMNTSDARIYGLEGGADAFLTQDARPEELLATVKALLRMRTTEMRLRRKNARLKIISEAAAHLLASQDPETMVKDLFEKVADHLGLDTYFNFMVNAEGDALILHSYAGISEEVAEKIQRLEFGQALCGTSALELKPITVSYIQNSDDPKAAPIREVGIRAYTCNPLIAGGRLLGTLSFATRNRDAFDNSELEFMRTICHYVALVKEKQEMLQKAQQTAKELEAANKRKDDFLANMSHEIRTPMNAVIGLSQILMMSSPLTKKQEEYIRILHTSAQSLLLLINDLLDIAKIESAHVELEETAFDLNQLLEEVVTVSSVQADSKNIALHNSYNVPRKQGFIGDPVRLKQILFNLVSNAIKFTEKGEVTVTVDVNEQSERVTLVDISVRDTGIGIPPDKLDSIFGKFSQGESSITRKYGGTGLGLAITKGLVELMGGTISVRSVVGEGSEFSITIPLAHAAQHPAPLAAEQKSDGPAVNEANVHSPLILVAEDYQPNVLVVATWLRGLGYRYEVVHNGAEAIEKVFSKRFDMVLMDVQMPDMSGLEATRKIRKLQQQHKTPYIPIIGLTAYASRKDREEGLAAGMDDYISKPFNHQEFEGKIAGFFKQKAA